ncbi:ImmA/IrrE family metallo-endopeptidase [Lactococcus sp.]|uniref:ImmA/IrrE family metallo-endopeptidase n=1 Tax=Lactococcus sp. TaxID=44273 RepID=UPI0035B12302
MNVWKLARELGADVVFFTPNEVTKKDGMYYKELNLICLNTLSSTKRQENVLYHEIGHHAYGHQHFDINSKSYSIKQEAEANRYMVKQRADEWLSAYDWEPEYIDIDSFLNFFEIDDRLYYLAEDVFHDILGWSMLSRLS